jgi:hypothetical protein
VSARSPTDRRRCLLHPARGRHFHFHKRGSGNLEMEMKKGLPQKTVGEVADLDETELFLETKRNRRRRPHNLLPRPQTQPIRIAPVSAACSNLPCTENLERRHRCHAPYPRCCHPSPNSIRLTSYDNRLFSAGRLHAVWHTLCISLLTLVRGLAEVAQHSSHVKPCRLLWWGEFQWLP